MHYEKPFNIHIHTYTYSTPIQLLRVPRRAVARGGRPELRNQTAPTLQVVAAGRGNYERRRWGGILTDRSQGWGKDLETNKGSYIMWV